MTAILFYIFLYPLSLLPFSVLHGISNILYVLVYHVVGYRKNVVRDQLSKSFPEKDKNELHQIEKKFYLHFCDFLVESAKLFSISKEEIVKRVYIRNPEFLDKFYEEKRHVICVLGHYNNWEMMSCGIPPQIKHLGVVIYSTLSNKFFNEKIKSSRGRFGMKLFSKKEIKAWLSQNHDQPMITFFAADQFPKKAKKVYNTRFLNQDTSVAFGAERYATTNNWPVVFLNSVKTKRGTQELFFELISENPKDEPHGAIMEKYTRMLEKQIQNEPSNWLWTHKRWKFRKT